MTIIIKELDPVIELPDFNIEEFDCKCGCGLNNMKQTFLWRLQQARTLAKIPFIINSGCRCKAHNKSVGGKPDSEHMTGEAVDIKVNSSNVRYRIISAALEVGITRIGVGDTYIHLGDSMYKPRNVIWTY